MKSNFLILLFLAVTALSLNLSPSKADTFVVTSTLTAGPGTLREAVIQANALPDFDTIEFNLPANSNISLAAGLIPLNAPVFVDGSTSQGVTLTGSPGIGLEVNGDNVFIRDLTLGGCVLQGIAINGDSCTVQGCQIGLATQGTLGNGNGQNGILVNSTIGVQLGGTELGEGNVISSNGATGINVLNSSNVRIEGNIIGLSAQGDADLGNGAQGVIIFGGSDIVLHDNIISGNQSHGVEVVGNVPVTDLTFSGNFIGIDASGSIQFENMGHGLLIQNAENLTIGGLHDSLRNVISGNFDHGIHPIDSRNIQILGNYIGISADGVTGIANGWDVGSQGGIFVQGGSDVRIGSVGAGRNVVAFNGAFDPSANWSFQGGQPVGNGIDLAFTTGNIVVEGNFIGLNAHGDTLGNAENGLVLTGINGAQVLNNVVANNQFQGIEVYNSSNTIIRGNYIGTDTTGRVGDGRYGNGTGFSGNFTWGGSGTWFGNGIQLEGSSGTVIGGVQDGEENIIIRNGENGIRIQGSPGAEIFGNLIGVDIDTVDAGNLNSGIMMNAQVRDYDGDGTDEFGESHSNIIGGLNNGEPNIIATNGHHGVYVTNVNSIGNTISSNSIYCNGTDPSFQGVPRGIELEDGGNEEFSSNNDAAVILIDLFNLEGTAEGLTNGAIVEVFKFPIECDCYQGKDLIGRDTVSGSGDVIWNVTLTSQLQLPIGVSFTVTDPVTGNTSEFSNCCVTYAGELLQDDTICQGESYELALTQFVGEEGRLQQTSDTTNGGSWTNVGAWQNLTNDTTWTVTPTITGANPMYYRVMVRTGIGCEDSSNAVAIHVEHASIGNVSPIPSEICVGETINLNTSGFSGVLEWADSTECQGAWEVLSSNSSFNDLPVLPEDDTIYYRLRATFNQCLDTAIFAAVVVHPFPSFAVSPTLPSCAGGDGALAVTGLESNGFYEISFESPGWSIVRNIQADNNGEVLFSDLPNGTYGEFQVSQYSCSTTDTAVFTLTSPDAPMFSGVVTEPGCSNDDGTIQLTGLTSNQLYGVSYEGPEGVVDLGAFTTGSLGDFEITSLSSGQYTVSIDSAGCAGVEVFELQELYVPAFTVVTVPPACGLSEGALSIRGLLPGNAYDISYEDAFGNTQELTSVIADSDGAFMVTGLVEGDYGQIRFTDQVSTCTGEDGDTYNITALPFPAFTVTPVNPTTCLGDEGELRVVGLDPETEYSMTLAVGQQVTTDLITTSSVGEYEVLGLSAGVIDSLTFERNGCRASQGPFELTNPIYIPEVSIQAGDDYCAGESATASILALLNEGDAPSYNWILNGVSTGTNVNFSTATLEEGQYSITLELTSNNPCASPATVLSNQLNLTVRQTVPEVDILVPEVQCMGSEYDLDLNLINEGQFPIYQWFVNGGLVSVGGGDSQLSSVFEIGDSVSVELTPSQDVCPLGIATDYMIIAYDSCLPPPPIRIPNALTPDNGDQANQTFFVENIEHYPDNVLWIYNRWGNLVYKASPYQNEWEGKRDGNDLPKAVYYYVLHLRNEGDDKYAGAVAIHR